MILPGGNASAYYTSLICYQRKYYVFLKPCNFFTQKVNISVCLIDLFKQLLTFILTAKQKRVKYKCKLCSYRTHTHDKIINHQRTHEMTKPFPCNICKRRFKENDELLEHAHLHTGEKTHNATKKSDVDGEVNDMSHLIDIDEEALKKGIIDSCHVKIFGFSLFWQSVCPNGAAFS